MVAAAMSAPVGRPPLVARMLRVRFGAVPVQPLQNRLTSTLVSWPVTAGVKLWPPQEVVVMPTPLLLSVAFCWSTVAAFSRMTSPGLVVRSTLGVTPLWNTSTLLPSPHPPPPPYPHATPPLTL